MLCDCVKYNIFRVLHTLNLAVQESLEQFTPLLEKCRAIVAHFSRSTKARDRLEQIQEVLKEKVLFCFIPYSLGFDSNCRRSYQMELNLLYDQKIE